MVGVRVWGVFIFIPVAYILWAFLMKKNYFTCTFWIWDGYSQLGAARLVGYLSPHIQFALEE